MRPARVTKGRESAIVAISALSGPRMEAVVIIPGVPCHVKRLWALAIDPRGAIRLDVRPTRSHGRTVITRNDSGPGIAAVKATGFSVHPGTRRP